MVKYRTRESRLYSKTLFICPNTTGPTSALKPIWLPMSGAMFTFTFEGTYAKVNVYGRHKQGAVRGSVTVKTGRVGALAPFGMGQARGPRTYRGMR